MATVVVIDDETMNADALAFVLTAEGLEVRTAADGEVGLRLISDIQPDVIVTDFMMPIMTGFDLARAVRADPSHVISKIPIVLLTAAQAKIGRSHPDLFDVVFEKPCSPKEIVAAVLRLAKQQRNT
ncbi:response regulator [Cupriavidus sp. U2]|uniref:response regulator transcription factor n=1 Tax=Cupriavidus sp. U2 TaxID=2920269 RepID=UPI00129EBFFA|nr:response regulator [Cupriavidus sp. U2]